MLHFAVVADPTGVADSLPSSSLVGATSYLSSTGASTVHVLFQTSMRRGVRRVSSVSKMVFPIQHAGNSLLELSNPFSANIGIEVIILDLATRVLDCSFRLDLPR